ncbi:hypothetical protein B0H11DRAFT_2196075 [Mycena galericulata]|nr:hypothetical protein B0H11DRAFT_2196075 [Mycena galericulata]
MADTNDSESDAGSDSGVARTFDLPSQNATREELYEVCIFQLTFNATDRKMVTQVIKNLQLNSARLVVENRDLLLKVAALKASGKKRKPEEENPMAYLDVIILLGKKFGFMHEPWISPAVFAPPPLNPPPQGTAAEIEAMFKSQKLYLQYVTSTLYAHVPSKYHELVDSSTFPGFGENFMKHLNAGRSSAVNSLKTHLPQIFADFKIANEKKVLLYHPGDDTSLSPTAYPPIFYPNLKKNAQTVLLNEALPMALRCMLFGSASIKNRGTEKPQAGTLAYRWQLDGLSVGSICFTLTVLLRVISEVDAVFESTGKVSKIPYQIYFHKYKKMLMKNAGSPGVRNILKVWTKIVFKGATTIVSMDEDTEADDDLADAAMEAEFAAAMEGMNISDGPDDDFDFGEGDPGINHELSGTHAMAPVVPPIDVDAEYQAARGEGRGLEAGSGVSDASTAQRRGGRRGTAPAAPADIDAEPEVVARPRRVTRRVGR